MSGEQRDTGHNYSSSIIHCFLHANIVSSHSTLDNIFRRYRILTNPQASAYFPRQAYVSPKLKDRIWKYAEKVQRSTLRLSECKEDTIHTNALWRIDELLGNGSVNKFQQTLGQQYRSGVFCDPCCARCYAARTERFATISDVFSTDPPRDYVSNPFVKRDSFVLESAVSRRRSDFRVVEPEREWSESTAVKEEEFGWRLSVSSCNWQWLSEIVNVRCR
jgi:hypothetical protein